MPVDHGRGARGFAGDAEKDRGHISGRCGDGRDTNQKSDGLMRLQRQDERDQERDRCRATKTRQNAHEASHEDADEEKTENRQTKHSACFDLASLRRKARDLREPVPRAGGKGEQSCDVGGDFVAGQRVDTES